MHAPPECVLAVKYSQSNSTWSLRSPCGYGEPQQQVWMWHADGMLLMFGVNSGACLHLTDTGVFTCGRGWPSHSAASMRGAQAPAQNHMERTSSHLAHKAQDREHAVHVYIAYDCLAAGLHSVALSALLGVPACKGTTVSSPRGSSMQRDQVSGKGTTHLAQATAGDGPGALQRLDTVES